MCTLLLTYRTHPRAPGRTGGRDDLEQFANASCGYCWNKTWSGFSDAEMQTCVSVVPGDFTYGPYIDFCHMCGKSCGTVLNLTKHGKTLEHLIKRAEGLSATPGACSAPR
jgi:hypothetical protein